MPPGDRYQRWVADDGTTHALFKGEVDACARVTNDVTRCEQMREWLASAVRAFLDPYLRRGHGGGLLGHRRSGRGVRRRDRVELEAGHDQGRAAGSPAARSLSTAASCVRDRTPSLR